MKLADVTKQLDANNAGKPRVLIWQVGAITWSGHATFLHQRFADVDLESQRVYAHRGRSVTALPRAVPSGPSKGERRVPSRRYLGGSRFI